MIINNLHKLLLIVKTELKDEAEELERLFDDDEENSKSKDEIDIVEDILKVI